MLFERPSAQPLQTGRKAVLCKAWPHAPYQGCWLAARMPYEWLSARRAVNRSWPPPAGRGAVWTPLLLALHILHQPLLQAGDMAEPLLH